MEHEYFDHVKEFYELKEITEREYEEKEKEKSLNEKRRLLFDVEEEEVKTASNI